MLTMDPLVHNLGAFGEAAATMYSWGKAQVDVVNGMVAMGVLAEKDAQEILAASLATRDLILGLLQKNEKQRQEAAKQPSSAAGSGKPTGAAKAARDAE